MSASAFSLTAMVLAQNFRVLEGEPVKGGIKGPQLDHFFCPDCKTWMFTRIVGMDDIVNVRPTMFDDPASTPAVHSFEGFPPREAFSRLMQEFAARS